METKISYRKLESLRVHHHQSNANNPKYCKKCNSSTKLNSYLCQLIAMYGAHCKTMTMKFDLKGVLTKCMVRHGTGMMVLE